MTKQFEIFSLLVLCILVLSFPNYINNLYETILGRFVLIIVLIYLTLNNITFGLLFALSLIIVLRLYFREGLENNNNDKKIKVLTKMTSKNKENDDENDEKNDGIDRQTIEESVRPVSSKELNNQITNNSENNEILPNDTTSEQFTCLDSLYN
jgi:uncharacterized membrane protein YciS (DUF1049 family)